MWAMRKVLLATLIGAVSSWAPVSLPPKQATRLAQGRRGSLRTLRAAGDEASLEAPQGDVWLSRKISVLAPAPGACVGGVTGLVTQSFREVEQFRVGLAHLQVPRL